MLQDLGRYSEWQRSICAPNRRFSTISYEDVQANGLLLSYAEVPSHLRKSINSLSPAWKLRPRTLLTNRQESVGEPIAVVQALARMRGGSQSHLMRTAGNELWVVKFRNNPQHRRTLVNDLIATRLAEAIGLSVPESSVVYVSPRIVNYGPGIVFEHASGGCEPAESGLQFGSRYVGGLMPGQVMDWLPPACLKQLRNLKEFAGILALDKWTGNCDCRQVVFKRGSNERRYKAFFIDQGFCFNGGEWNFPDSPISGIYAHTDVYSRVTGWDSFEPWLSRIEQFNVDEMVSIVDIIPSEWYDNEHALLEDLVMRLIKRRDSVRDLIDQLRLSDRNPFPNWTTNIGKTSNFSTNRDLDDCSSARAV